MEMESGFRGLVWDGLGLVWVFGGGFSFVLWVFLVFCFHFYQLVGWFGRGGGVQGFIVPGGVFFGLSEDFSFASRAFSCLVFALLSIHLLGF
jgi:hypothetical protein